MNGNTNMLLFVDSATVAYMNSSSNFRGMSHNADDDIEVYFQSASDASSFDTVLLSCGDEKQVEAMKGLAGAINGSASKAFTDDVEGTYCHQDITAIESVTLGQKGSLTPIEVLTAARVVANADSGTTFICSGGAGKAITLPAVADVTAGWNCKFIVGQAFATTDWIITATAAIMVGGINELEVDTSDDGPSTVAGTTINIELGAETIGDFVEFVCDGTKFYINGQTKLDGGMTLA